MAINIRELRDKETRELFYPKTHVNAVVGLVDQSFFEVVIIDGHPTVKLKDEYAGLWTEGWMADGGIGTGGGGGGGTYVAWGTKVGNTRPLTVEGVTETLLLEGALSGYALQSWVLGQGFVLPADLVTINHQPLIGSGDITVQDGTDGKSAYQIWLDAGHVGTEADFLASLQGNPGSSQAYPFTLVNNLTDGGTGEALTAEQGKVLAGMIEFVRNLIQSPAVDTLPYEIVKVNLFDPADVTTGYYLDGNGNLQSNANYLATGYIPFTPSMGKLILSVNGNPVGAYDGGNIVLYDAQHNRINAFVEGTVGGCVEWEDKVAFARFSVPNYSAGSIQIEIGDTVTSYLAPGLLLLRDAVMVPGSAIEDGTVSGAKVGNGEISPEKCGFFKVNLYDPDDSDVKDGYYLDNHGTLQPNANWLVTGYIPFNSGKICASANGQAADGGGHFVLYDREKRIVSIIRSDSTHNVATWQANVAYVRFSLNADEDDSIQVELGDTITDYIEPGVYALDPAIKVTSELPDGSVTNNKIANGAVSPEKCDFFKANLFNPNDPDVKAGYYLDGNGTLNSNANWLTTGYIPFSSGKMCASVNGQSADGGGFIVLYNANKQKVASVMGANTHNVATWQDGVAYVRFSLTGYTAGNIQVEMGETISAYMPYGDAILDPKYTGVKPQVDSLLGQDAGRKTAASLSANTNLELDDYPYHIKKGECISFYAKISTITAIYVGKGYTQYRGTWLKITSSSLILQHYESSTADVATVAHGLTLSTFVKVAMTSDKDGNWKVVLQTLGGTYQHTFGGNYGTESNYKVFARGEGGTMTEVVLNATNTDFRCPVWAMGDSYFGVNAGRWPGWMFDFGYTNWCINGLAGASSNGAFADLQRMLNFGTPKYLLWMLGMNDSVSRFEEYFEKVKTLCDQYGITMIASTIPTVPTRLEKEDISAYVRASGVRYVDMYKAVGADSSGNWYTGYLDDGVHPTTIGAQAIATQVLVDFPELMQYGNTKEVQ